MEKKTYLPPVTTDEGLGAYMDMMQTLDVSDTDTGTQYINVREDVEYNDLDSLLVGSTDGWEKGLW